jgi:DNA-binding CsgD family transcriptional regulator/tetratricopeptide (TPR) repeat protein
VLRRLLERGNGVLATARLVHHATGAGDDAAVRHYAPEAAREASALGAHREAAAHYRTALKHTPADDIEGRATLSEGYAYECHLIDRMDEAISARRTALQLRQRQGDLRKAGDNLRWLSRVSWYGGRGEEARALGLQAVQMLEPLPPGPELAMAYSNMAQLHMLAENGPEAVRWGERALRLAEPLGLIEAQVHALNNIGTAELWMGNLAGRAKLERSLELALSHELHEHAARAYINLAGQAVIDRDYARAQRWFAEGLAYTRERDLDSSTLFMLADRARAHLEQGLWQKAEDDASAALAATQTPITRGLAVIVLGCVRLRRGGPGADAMLDEGRKLALVTDDIQIIGPMAAARAEAAWLKGDPEQMRAEAEAVYELALRHPGPWRRGELALWLWRAGALDRAPEGAALPYRLEISGDWQAAAAAWQRIGCPYEQALALAHGDRPAQLQALDILTKLGAAPAAAIVRRDLRAGGLHGIPRGPRAATKGNPLGLTARQVDILRLLAGDLANKEIAAELRISPKTVDHHVSAVLAKLGVSTRREAGRHPITRAFLAQSREPAGET